MIEPPTNSLNKKRAFLFSPDGTFKILDLIKIQKVWFFGALFAHEVGLLRFIRGVLLAVVH